MKADIYVVFFPPERPRWSLVPTAPGKVCRAARAGSSSGAGIQLVLQHYLVALNAGQQGGS